MTRRVDEATIRKNNNNRLLAVILSFLLNHYESHLINLNGMGRTEKGEQKRL